MVRELFENIFGALRDSIVHLSNADPLTLILVVGGIVLLAYFLLRR